MALHLGDHHLASPVARDLHHIVLAERVHDTR
jgi:hypothetical protein